MIIAWYFSKSLPHTLNRNANQFYILYTSILMIEKKVYEKYISRILRKLCFLEKKCLRKNQSMAIFLFIFIVFHQNYYCKINLYSYSTWKNLGLIKRTKNTAGTWKNLGSTRLEFFVHLEFYAYQAFEGILGLLWKEVEF